MTSNVFKGRADPEAFAGLLDAVRPNVLVIQELGHNLVPVIETRFRNHTLHPSDEFIGRGIATDFPAKFGVIDMPVRTGTSAVLGVAGDTWHVAGAHLANAVEWPFWGSVRSRITQIEALESWIDQRPDGPTIVAGDFNASPAWPAYKRITKRLDDVVSEVAVENTWGWRPGWPLMLRIDHVFASGLVAEAVSVHPIEGSDHRAVVVDLKRDENGSE